MNRPFALCSLLLLTGLHLEAGVTDPKNSPIAPAQPTPADPFADRLLGDWGGFRTVLAKSGLSFDLEYTQFYQGLLSGDGSYDEWDLGGRVDAFFNVDTGKLGLWEGGAIRTHVEYRYGDLRGFRGGALWPAHTAGVLPLGPGDEIVASSIYVTQRLGDHVNLMAGKINALDLLASDPFFGGWGIRRFQNLVFAAPPSGVVPPVIYGAIANIKTAPITWTLMVFDPEDRTNEYWPDDLFSTGVNYSLGATYAFKVAGRSSSLNATGTYSTKDGANLGELLLPDELRTGNKDGAYNVSLQFSHLLVEKPDSPGSGWGVFVKGALADGNPNPIQRSIIVGLGGRGIIPGREDDTFGVGYFCYNLSDDLQSAVSPLLEIGDEQGLEIFYSVALLPGLTITADVQVIDPALGANGTAVVGGLRANLRF